MRRNDCFNQARRLCTLIFAAALFIQLFHQEMACCCCDCCCCCCPCCCCCCGGGSGNNNNNSELNALNILNRLDLGYNSAFTGAAAPFGSNSASLGPGFLPDGSSGRRLTSLGLNGFGRRKRHTPGFGSLFSNMSTSTLTTTLQPARRMFPARRACSAILKRNCAEYCKHVCAPVKNVTAHLRRVERSAPLLSTAASYMIVNLNASVNTLPATSTPASQQLAKVSENGSLEDDGNEEDYI